MVDCDQEQDTPHRTHVLYTGKATPLPGIPAKKTHRNHHLMVINRPKKEYRRRRRKKRRKNYSFIFPILKNSNINNKNSKSNISSFLFHIGLKCDLPSKKLNLNGTLYTLDVEQAIGYMGSFNEKRTSLQTWE